MKEIISVLLSPRGRIRRRDFWFAFVAVFVFGIGLSQARDALQLFGGLAWAYLTVCIYGKRLHDVGRSAWQLSWPFVLTVASYAGMAMYISSAMSGQISYYDMVGMQSTLTVIGLIPLIVWAVTTLIAGLPAGVSGDNRFGADPLVTEVIAKAPGRAAA